MVKLKKTLAILLAVMFVMSLTVAAVDARPHGGGGWKHGGGGGWKHGGGHWGHGGGWGGHWGGNWGGNWGWGGWRSCDCDCWDHRCGCCGTWW